MIEHEPATYAALYCQLSNATGVVYVGRSGPRITANVRPAGRSA